MTTESSTYAIYRPLLGWFQPGPFVVEPTGVGREQGLTPTPLTQLTCISFHPATVVWRCIMALFKHVLPRFITCLALLGAPLASVHAVPVLSLSASNPNGIVLLRVNATDFVDLYGYE